MSSCSLLSTAGTHCLYLTYLPLPNSCLPLSTPTVFYPWWLCILNILLLATTCCQLIVHTYCVLDPYPLPHFYSCLLPLVPLYSKQPAVSWLYTHSVLDPYPLILVYSSLYFYCHLALCLCSPNILPSATTCCQLRVHTLLCVLDPTDSCLLLSLLLLSLDSKRTSCSCICCMIWLLSAILRLWDTNSSLSRFISAFNALSLSCN